MARPPSPADRGGGILLHITSLPSLYGIGDLGPAARRWIDLLAGAGLSWWQMLPLGPPAAGNSPYQSCSAFAGNPLLISPEDLRRAGLVARGSIRARRFGAGLIDHDRVARFKARLLREACETFFTRPDSRLEKSFDRFRREQAHWLDDYAVFTAIRAQQGGEGWLDWPKGLRFREPRAMRAFVRENSDSIDRERFVQFLFFRQLAELRAHARGRGVGLIGDMPIFVAGDSADVWAHPDLFQLDRCRRPRFISGVPPDLFSRTGQLWGNPLYDWAANRREGYRWWIQRLGGALAQADLVRIDHFRGFAGYWRIPAGAPTAQTGRWMPGPGEDLFKAIARALPTAARGGLPLIAEDLGLITPDVIELRQRVGLPGMRVLQFAFGSGPDNPHLPHNHEARSIVYTGTHDNDTTVGWLRDLPTRQRRALIAYAPAARADPAGEMIRLAWASVAHLAIVPMQDVLRLGSRARMNTPGRADNNWRWRMTPEQMTAEALAPLAKLNRIYGRSNSVEG